MASAQSSPSGASSLHAEDFAPPLLNPVQQRVLDDLRSDGIAVVRFADLHGDELWRDAAADIEPFIRATEAAVRDAGDAPAGKEDLIVRRFFDSKAKNSPETLQMLPISSPWLRIAASELMLDIVNSYRGHLTRLYYVDNWYTVPYPAAETRVLSQRWHRDPEEAHVVKVFIYFSDVDEGAGPFEYIRGSTTGARYGDLWPWGIDSRIPPTPNLEAATDPADRIALTGPSGTMIFCDTGGFHRGGFARTKSRILSTFTYVGGKSKRGKHRFRVDFEGAEASLRPQVHFALTA